MRVSLSSALVALVAVAASLVATSGPGCVGDTPDRTEETVAMGIQSVFETPTVGDRIAAAGEVFVVIRLTIRNPTTPSVIVEPSFFALSLDDGPPVGAFAIEGDDEACAGGRVAKDESLTCNLAFTIDEDASPELLRYRRGDLLLEASPDTPSLARCLIFEDTVDPACFELCTLETCFREDDDVSTSCSEACLSLCVDDEDPCFCAAAGCGPNCSDALRAYDACSAPCLVLCGPEL